MTAMKPANDHNNNRNRPRSIARDRSSPLALLCTLLIVTVIVLQVLSNQ